MALPVRGPDDAPFTVKVNCPLPAAALVGEMLVITGTGLLTGAGFTVVGSEAELLDGLLSPAVETLAALVTLGTAAGATPTVSVIVLMVLLPAMGPGLVQVTTWPLAEQLQPVPVPLTKLSPVGKLSVTVIGPVVAALPTLVTVRV